MPDQKPDADKPGLDQSKKPSGIELTEEDLRRVSGGKKEETSEKK